MAKKPKPEPDDKEQSKRFVDTAHQLEADERGKPFENAIKSVICSSDQTRQKSAKKKNQ